MINSLEMETLQNIKKTKTYEERKDYSLKNPEDKQHNDFTDLIDDFIKVSLHMKFISDIKLNRGKRNFDFEDYCQIYGIDYEGTGIMQTTGPFIFWADDNKNSYGVYYKRFFAEMFDVIFNKRISHDEIVENVEAFDLWWNS